MTIDWTAILSSLTTIGFVYAFLRNFKEDINRRLDRFEHRMDRFEERMNQFENKIISIEERLFFVATGRKIEDVIKEERLKALKTDQ